MLESCSTENVDVARSEVVAVLIAGIALNDLQITVTQRSTALTQVSDGQLTSITGQTVLPRQLLSFIYIHTYRPTHSHIGVHTADLINSMRKIHLH